MINYTIAGIIIFAGITLIFIGKPKMTVLMPAIGSILLIGFSIFIYQNWAKWKSPPKKSGIEKTSAKNQEQKPLVQLETVGNSPIIISGRTFSMNVGPDGERAGTGEIFTGIILEPGYSYHLILSGEFIKRFFKKSEKFNWRGWNPQSQGINKPFSSFPYGALMLRIGNKQGLHPEDGKDYVVYTPNQHERVFVELNINREFDDYYDSRGVKISNSTLSLKVERRPI